jgi:hypothetical protein
VSDTLNEQKEYKHSDRSQNKAIQYNTTQHNNNNNKALTRQSEVWSLEQIENARRWVGSAWRWCAEVVAVGVERVGREAE